MIEKGNQNARNGSSIFSSHAGCSLSTRRGSWLARLLALPLALASVVALSVCITTTNRITRVLNDLSPPDYSMPANAKNKTKLADGCHHVFIDVGANLGVHSRFLFEPDQYRNATTALQIFERHFGSKRDYRDLCAFSFEPNPAHWPRHQQLAAAYQAVGMRYHPIHAGVSDIDGTMSFYHERSNKNEEWGFSVRDNGGQEEVVPVIRLASWLRDNVLDRQPPDVIYGIDTANTINKPKVVMKMDIEGMELIVLPDLITSGVLCQTVDYLFMELHWWSLVLPPPPTSPVSSGAAGLQGGLYLTEGGVASRDYAKHLIQAFHAPRSGECRTEKIELLDDESYLHDGVPFPTAS